MINGRVNESKESDFMKMKKILVSMFLLLFGTVSKVECFKCSGNGCAEPVGFNKGIYCGAKQYTISCVFVKGQKRELDFYGGFIGQKENARYHNSSKN